MHIELRKLSISRALSEETTAYSAEIWIDGIKAFAASNHGHGGSDLYRQLGAVTEAEVDAWLKVNRSPRHFDGLTLEPDLETEIARLIDAVETRRVLLRKLKTAVVTIEDDAVFTYPLRNRDRSALVAALARSKPSATIVTVDDEATIARAIDLTAAGDD